MSLPIRLFLSSLSEPQRILFDPLRKIRDYIESIIEKPILTSAIVLLLMSILVMGLSFEYYVNDTESFMKNILGEAHGMLFDIAIIGMLIFWLNQNGQKRQLIRTYKDEIDDFRMWESEEASFRTVGNIKRLNRNNIHEINLVNCHLRKTNLSNVNLKGSNMNSADLSHAMLIDINLESTRLNQTNFEDSNMNQANLNNAFASGASFKDAFLIKSSFAGAFLIKANFQNAYLMESNLSGCDLSGVDFENANLYKADFRNSNGLSVEQLSVAKSLYLAKFDLELQQEIEEQLPELMG